MKARLYAMFDTVKQKIYPWKSVVPYSTTQYKLDLRKNQEYFRVKTKGRISANIASVYSFSDVHTMQLTWLSQDKCV